MLIINADDYGRNVLATEHILACVNNMTVTSVSAMVFTNDSQRAAKLAKENGVKAGLHLNLTEETFQHFNDFSYHMHFKKVRQFLTKSKYHFLLYNPFLCESFRYVFNAQFNEFCMLYGSKPTHIDGHHHMHLSMNYNLSSIIPKRLKMRGSFTYFKSEKNILNRLCRKAINKYQSRHYRMADCLFSLSESVANNTLDSYLDLSRNMNVELQTHPEVLSEFQLLKSNEFKEKISSIQLGSYDEIV